MKEALEKRLCQRKALLPLIAAVLYTACRMDGFPRSIKEIASSAGTDHKAVSKIFALICKHIDANVGRVSPQQLIMRMCSELKIPVEHVEVCRITCGTVFNEGILEGCQQNVIAAAVLLLIISSLKIEIETATVARIAVCEKSALLSALKKLLPFSKELLRAHNIEGFVETESDTLPLIEKERDVADIKYCNTAISSNVDTVQSTQAAKSMDPSI